MAGRSRRTTVPVLGAAAAIVVAAAVAAWLVTRGGVDGEAAREFSECMRDNGVEDFPEPSGRGVRISPEMTDDPDWDAAHEACSHLIDNGSGRFTR